VNILYFSVDANISRIACQLRSEILFKTLIERIVKTIQNQKNGENAARENSGIPIGDVDHLRFSNSISAIGSRLCKLESDVLLDARGYVNVLSDAWYSVVLTLERLIAELLNVLKTIEFKDTLPRSRYYIRRYTKDRHNLGYKLAHNDLAKYCKILLTRTKNNIHWMTKR
jgi:hypothetical protein